MAFRDSYLGRLRQRVGSGLVLMPGAMAVTEVREEVGLEIAVEDLIPFGSLSAAETHAIRYPSGDVTHCFALLFLVRQWNGDPITDGSEAIEARFVELGRPPEPMMAPARTALDLFGACLSSGRFQLG